MKKILIPLVIILFGCNSSSVHKKDTEVDSNNQKGVTIHSKLDNVKDISDYELAFLDADINKALTILGEPDDKGESYSLRRGHYVWYDKVKKDGAIKHLVIYFSYDDRSATVKTIKTVSAILDGTNFSQVRYGSIRIKKPRGFGQELNNVDLKVDIINKDYQAIDLAKLAKLEITNGSSIYTCYYDDHLDLKVVKEDYELEGGNILTWVHFYNDQKLRMISKYDTKKNLMSEKTYVYNDKVILYLLNEKETKCEECSFDKYSRPYHILDLFNSEFGGD